HQFTAVDSSPQVDIHFGSISVDDLLSEDGVLPLNFESEEELDAVYHHVLQNADIVNLEIESVSWEIAGDLIKGNTFELGSYTDRNGQRTVTLTVETNYGGK